MLGCISRNGAARALVPKAINQLMPGGEAELGDAALGRLYPERHYRAAQPRLSAASLNRSLATWRGLMILALASIMRRARDTIG
jgi:hypothetical protein